MQLAFDAIQLTRVGDFVEDDDDNDGTPDGGCTAAAGANGAIWLLAIAGVLRFGRRRRR
jgi:MYXO-CTERM domain-containing protein